MGIFDCGFDVYLCCAADPRSSSEFPVLLCDWDEAENWDHWSDIPKGKAGSISWSRTLSIKPRKSLSSEMLRGENFLLLEKNSLWGINLNKTKWFCIVCLSLFREFFRAPRLQFLECSGNEQLGVGVQAQLGLLLVPLRCSGKWSRRIVAVPWLG